MRASARVIVRLAVSSCCGLAAGCFVDSLVDDDTTDPGTADATGNRTSTSAADGDSSETTASSTGGVDTTGVDSESDGESSTGEPPTASFNLAFVTSETYVPSEIDGLANADALCNELAAGGNLDGTYVAWLSGRAATAIERLGDAQGWIRPDGRIVAQNQANLGQALLLHPIQLDEAGNPWPNSVVATGTSDMGALLPSCGDWSPAGAKDMFRAGTTSHTGSRWTSSTVLTCDTPARLYCFGIDHEAEPEPPRIEGRRAFVTVGTVAPTDGIEAMDNLCQAEAGAAGLEGAYLAFVANEGAGPIARFNVDGLPWLNLAGAPLVDTAGALALAEAINAPVQFSASGAPSSQPIIITGALNPQTAGQDCDGWSSASGDYDRGDAYSAENWLRNGSRPCSEAAAVFCFEQ